MRSQLGDNALRRGHCSDHSRVRDRPRDPGVYLSLNPGRAEPCSVYSVWLGGGSGRCSGGYQGVCECLRVCVVCVCVCVS